MRIGTFATGIESDDFDFSLRFVGCFVGTHVADGHWFLNGVIGRFSKGLHDAYSLSSRVGRFG